MKHRPLSVAVAALAVAVTPLVAQAPAAAGPGDPKKKDLRETECRDIVDGVARYDRDRTLDVPELQAPDGSYPDDLQGDAGTAQLTLELAAPSCSTVAYTLIVYGGDGQVLATTSAPGDGVKGTAEDNLVLSQRVEGYAEDCLMLVATTSVQGVTVDTAPDAVPSYRDVCDGASPGLTYR